ncbi:uncharacterized protein [Amphiura filiformis]|uniref:uncharacterized protein n=1 Tax=Amphiura filiformis TaxID=82378 RepID=UPI003B226E43
MNLFNDVRQLYGQSTVKKIRDYENIENKLARHKNHLVFSLRCKDEGLIPPSLKLRCPINTTKARDIINKAQKDLLQKSSEKTFKAAKCRQIKKLERLAEKSQLSATTTSHHNTAEDVDLGGSHLKKWVINLPKYKLSTAQTSILAKGLNFAPTPSHIPVDDFIEATERACTRLPKPEAAQLRAEVVGSLKSSKLPKSNLSKDEQQALRDLKAEKSILILPSDKGRCSVVMDKSDYESKVHAMLDDDKTYAKLNKDPTAKYKSELVRILTRLKQENKITQTDYQYLYPTSESIPRIYCTPKIHKPGTPLRPIVDYTGSIGYATSRSLADILGPLIGNTEHHVNNSAQLAEDLSEVMIEEDNMFISHDVVSLFTNTPIDKALEVIKDRLAGDKTLKSGHFSA